MKKHTLAAVAPIVLAFAVQADAQLIAADSFVTGPGPDTYNNNGGYNGARTRPRASSASALPGPSAPPTCRAATARWHEPPATDNYADGGKGRYIAAASNGLFRRGFRPLDAYTPRPTATTTS